MECPVCLETINADDVYTTSCNHKFCNNCIERVSNTTCFNCPICRCGCDRIRDIINSTDVNELYNIYKNIIESEDSRRLFLSPDLRNIIGFVLTSKDKRLLEYILNESDDNEFKHMYKSMVVEGKKNFIKIPDPINDFALSLLYYKYH